MVSGIVQKLSSAHSKHKYVKCFTSFECRYNMFFYNWNGGIVLYVNGEMSHCHTTVGWRNAIVTNLDTGGNKNSKPKRKQNHSNGLSLLINS